MTTNARAAKRERQKAAKEARRAERARIRDLSTQEIAEGVAEEGELPPFPVSVGDGAVKLQVHTYVGGIPAELRDALSELPDADVAVVERPVTFVFIREGVIAHGG